MKLSVPTNWQDDLLEKVCVSSVSEFYGKANSDIVGGGRSSSVIPAPSQRSLEQQIRKIQDKGLRFNYLLNATCVGALEDTPAGQAMLRRLLEWLRGNRVNSVTVARPALLQFIKKEYPDCRVCVSTQAGVKDRHSAELWEDLGADAITLSFVDVNRNFRALREIRSSVRCDLQLIANLDCLYGCPYFRYHAHVTSHASQRGHRSKGFFIDYCFLKCNTLRLREPAEFMRSGWIRPEDVHYYESLGINALKVVSRAMPTDKIRLIVDAYTSGRYAGNLLDLFSDPAQNIGYKSPRTVKFFLRPDAVNIFKLYRFRNIFTPRQISIDNTALNGFLEYFLDNDCSERDCRTCGYCFSWARKALSWDSAYKEKTLRGLQGLLDAAVTGRIFR